MQMETVEIRVLKPDEGYWLTNGDTYSQLVYLGAEASPDDWEEISQEEYEKITEETEDDTYEPTIIK